MPRSRKKRRAGPRDVPCERCAFMVDYQGNPITGPVHNPSAPLSVGCAKFRSGGLTYANDTCAFAEPRDGMYYLPPLPPRPRRTARRRAISARRRYLVLQRDGFRCRYCGATGVPLHVDHITSVANGGTDDDQNLGAACADCNLGKGRLSA